MGGRLCVTSYNGAPCPVGTVVSLVRLQRTQRTEADSTGVAHENWHWGDTHRHITRDMKHEAYQQGGA